MVNLSTISNKSRPDKKHKTKVQHLHLTLVIMSALLFCLITLIIQAQTKKYSQCEFAKQLKNHGIQNKNDLDTCIAHHESGLDTKAVNKKTGDYEI